MLESFFKLKQNRTTAAREVGAGIVTFMTMAYIIFVNPGILSDALGKAYFPALTVATCIAAGVMTIGMGLFTNYPLALASGMGLNAVVAYGLVLGMKLPWQTAMGVIFVEGALITLLVLTKVREWVMEAIPMDLKRAIGVGIGLFIAFIGLKNAGLVVADKVTFLTFGKINAENGVALFGLLLTAVLMVRKVKGAILIGIVASTLVAMVGGLIQWPTRYVSGLRPEYFSTFFRLDIGSALNLSLITTIFALMISDFFDTMGTVVAVGEEAGLVTKDGRVPRLRNVLLVDSLAAVCGGLFGCSSVTTYVESAAGVGAGGRTGLTAVVTGLLFFLALFITPIVGIVPGYATAPALIVVGFLMLAVVKNINWEDLSVSIPASLTIIMIPLTYSIAKGIGYGFIAYVLIKAFSGKAREVRPLMYITALFFLLDFFLSSR